MMNEPTDYFSLDGQLKRGRPAHLDVTLHNQFATGSVWLRGNLHCHAGGHTGSPEQSAVVCQWYRVHGFDFVAVRHRLAEMGAEAAFDRWQKSLQKCVCVCTTTVKNYLDKTGLIKQCYRDGGEFLAEGFPDSRDGFAHLR